MEIISPSLLSLLPYLTSMNLCLSSRRACWRKGVAGSSNLVSLHPNFPYYTSHQVCFTPTYIPQCIHKFFQTRPFQIYRLALELNVKAALLHLLQPWVIITWWMFAFPGSSEGEDSTVKCFYWILSVQLSTQVPRNNTCWMNEWALDAQSLIYSQFISIYFFNFLFPLLVYHGGMQTSKRENWSLNWCLLMDQDDADEVLN